MKIKKLLYEIKILENDYKNLKKELKNCKILKSKGSSYLKEDKDSFKILWLKYIDFFLNLKKLIKYSKYRKYFFFVDYNKLIIRKYILMFYFNSLVDVLNIFGKHEKFLRIFLEENFKNDYGKFARYIYRPSYINLINTPNLFIKPFKKYIKNDILKLLDSNKTDIKIDKRFLADYNNIYFYIKNRFDKVIFSISKNIGSIIAKTKFSSRTHGLIKKENILKYLSIAKPGDIFLTRGNWNASNISIPGFWKHMSMYIGNGKYLKKNYLYKFLKDLEDEQDYIIEATGKGVNIVSIYELLGHNDYLGVSRVNFKKEKINRAINNSLKNIGKGYDHRFDYYSDNNLVCSELIMKSYAKEFKGDVGINIKLEQIGISLTYPPNNFVNLLFDGIEEVKPIFFIDSIEKTGENFISTINEFLKSRKRSRFSLFLK